VTRFRAIRAGSRGQNRFAVMDGEDVVLLTGWNRARALARYLSAWNPTPEELDGYLAWSSEEAEQFRRGMRRLELRFPAVCHPCGQTLAAGERALWDAETKTTLHTRRPCPLASRAVGKAARSLEEAGA